MNVNHNVCKHEQEPNDDEQEHLIEDGDCIVCESGHWLHCHDVEEHHALNDHVYEELERVIAFDEENGDNQDESEFELKTSVEM